ncbi:MAG TPA: hypothetical protein VGF84_11740 [Micromonosporaceae bacterium]
MTAILIVITVVLACVTSANLLLLFAVVRRLREIEASVNPPDRLPAAGFRIGEFRTGTTEGVPVVLDDLAGGPHLVAFVMPACHPCHAVLTSLRTDNGFDPARTLVLVSGDSANGETRAVIALADGLGRTVVIDPDGPVAAAFGGIDSFPTLLSVRDGRVAASGRTLDDVRPTGRLAHAG